MIAFPERLGRFDSIVDACKSDDLDAVRHAVESNMEVFEGILRELDREAGKALATFTALRLYHEELGRWANRGELEKDGAQSGQDLRGQAADWLRFTGTV